MMHSVRRQINNSIGNVTNINNIFFNVKVYMHFSNKNSKGDYLIKPMSRFVK